VSERAGCIFSAWELTVRTVKLTIGEHKKPVSKSAKDATNVRRQPKRERVESFRELRFLSYGFIPRRRTHWRNRLEQAQSPQSGRSREFILRKQILNLKRLLANKTMEVDFFTRACKE
jgi:hypothetical protein